MHGVFTRNTRSELRSLRIAQRELFITVLHLRYLECHEQQEKLILYALFREFYIQNNKILLNNSELKSNDVCI